MGGDEVILEIDGYGHRMNLRSVEMFGKYARPEFNHPPDDSVMRIEAATHRVGGRVGKLLEDDLVVLGESLLESSDLGPENDKNFNYQ